MKAGFNGARLHQKVFEERFLYHADRLGYLVWGEFGDWGCRYQSVDNHAQHHGITFAAQWAECLERDYSHPVDCRLVPAQRNLSRSARRNHRTRRRLPRDVFDDQT